LQSVVLKRLAIPEIPVPISLARQHVRPILAVKGRDERAGFSVFSALALLAQPGLRALDRCE
jgi:hypothetical protein